MPRGRTIKTKHLEATIINRTPISFIEREILYRKWPTPPIPSVIREIGSMTPFNWIIKDFEKGTMTDSQARKTFNKLQSKIDRYLFGGHREKYLASTQKRGFAIFLTNTVHTDNDAECTYHHKGPNHLSAIHMSREYATINTLKQQRNLIGTLIHESLHAIASANADPHTDSHHIHFNRCLIRCVTAVGFPLKRYDLLNPEQREVVETVLKAYEDRSEQRNFFVNGAAGTGKTFVYKCLYHLLSAKLAKVICIAHTGIAANLLVQGMTVHRAFSIPISKDEKVVCKVPFESPEAHRLKKVNVIIWDEATMSDKRILEAVNEWLMELHDRHNMPFGGVFTLLGGDWRQTLPIVAGGRDVEALTHCIKNSTMWRFYQQFYLCTNIRASMDPNFASFVLDVGNGDNYEDKQRSLVRLPEEVMLNTEAEVIDFVFENQQYSLKAAILTVDNRTANQINEKILKSLHGEQHTFKSIDKNDTDKNFRAMDPEFYHTMTPGGLPPHILNLKNGCNVILLRNMNVSLGLCNGTRMTVLHIAKDTVYCKPEKTQEATPEIVAIHRYTMSSTTTPRRECAFLRHQFPIRLCYAMTINKAQGQTLEKVGVILRTPVFSHGQLYVALSRVKTWRDIRVCNRVRGDDEDRALVTNKVLRKVFFMGIQVQDEDM